MTRHEKFFGEWLTGAKLGFQVKHEAKKYNIPRLTNRCYFLQKVGKIRTKTVNSSSRPSSMHSERVTLPIAGT